MYRNRLSPQRWRICVEAGLAAEVEMRLFSPLHGKPAYGSRARLIDYLLRRWLEEEGGGSSIPLPELDEAAIRAERAQELEVR